MRLARLLPRTRLRAKCSALPPSSTPATIREVLHPQASGRAGWVSDSAGVLTPAAVKRLNEKLDALKRTTSHEMAIVCLEDLDGQARKMGGGPPQSYGLFTEWLFDEWGVGRKEQNDGVMLVLYRRGRRVEIIFADVQGKEENLRESARYRPACFVSDGSHRREM